MRITKTLFWCYGILVAFSVVGSAVSMAMKVDSGAIAPITSALLLVVGACVVAIEIGDWPSVLALLMISAIAEAVGVLTGVPFGKYEYSSKWLPVVFIGHGVVFPILVPFAWLMIAGGCLLIFRRLGQRQWTAVLAAALAASIDLPLERAMVSVFGYWRWIVPGPVFGAPISNMVGWFVVAFFAILPAALRQSVPRHASFGPWVVALFCAFVASVGMMRAFDWAWVALGIISTCIGGVSLGTSRKPPS